MCASEGASGYGIVYFFDESGRPFAGRYESSVTSPQVLFHLISNDRGDVIGLVDSAGEQFAAYRYDAWGGVIGASTRQTAALGAQIAAAIAARQPLRYAGYVFDEHSQMYYLSQRYYDPATCQFLTKDPARDDGEESAYQYCGGDPVGKVDPSGLWAMQFRWPEGCSKNASSDYLTKVLQRNAGYAIKQALQHVGRPLRHLDWWKGMVNHQQEWDFKRIAKNRSKKSAWLWGRRISAEQFGNIHYGYVGRAAGFPLTVLLGGSVYASGKKMAQLANEVFSDHPEIRLGYYALPIEGACIRSGGRVDRWEM